MSEGKDSSTKNIGPKSVQQRGTISGFGAKAISDRERKLRDLKGLEKSKLDK